MGNQDDKLLISLSDVLALFRRSKWKILCCMALFSLLGGLIALARPIKYQVEATFREKSSKGAGVGASIAQLFVLDSLGGAGEESEAISMIKSRKLMGNVASQLNLQAEVASKCQQGGTLGLMHDNWKVEMAKLKRLPYPVLDDISCPLKVVSIAYDDEVPIYLELKLDDQGHYQVFNSDQQAIGEGKLDAPFISDRFSFSLTWSSLQPLRAQEFSFNIHPLISVADRLIQDLEIEGTKTDKGVLRLSYTHPDRHLACQFLNTVMATYQDYLKQNHDRIAAIQMDYLYKKKQKTDEELTYIMQQHAEFLTQDLSNTGFSDSKREMEFLAQSQHQLKEQLLANELEIKRLKNIQPNNYAYYDQVSHKEGNPVVINTILTEMRALKQERDTLELALRHSEFRDPAGVERALQQQLNELQTIQQYGQDLQQIMAKHKQKEPIDRSLPLMQDSRFLLAEWFDHLKGSQNQKTQDSFIAYLDNLERLFHVHEKILQERLTHQQKPSTEFQGIDLNTANDLYKDYCKLLSNEEAAIRRTLFFINQMEDPLFEITSLSSVLTDSVSSGMVSRASQLLINLKDQSNQSLKEQERLKAELSLQRMLLALHLQQMVQLMELNKKLLNEKIYALQNVNLELMHQKISLLEKNLKDYVYSRLENLQQERGIIKQHLEQIRAEMAGLPKKWMAQQQIDQQVESNQLIVREIAKIVESKNISHNLEVIQSAPIDLAMAPIHPKPSGFVFYSILGMAFGGLIGFIFTLGQSLSRGIPASSSSLKLMDWHVSGQLSSAYQPQAVPSKEDLDVLRRLQACFGSIEQTKLLLLIEGQAPDYASNLAQLLAQKDQKVLIMDLNLDRAQASPQPGLLQYLQKEVSVPTIIKDKAADYLPAGGTTPYAIELLSSSSFKDLLNQLKSKYDWIIAISHAMPCSVEAENLVSVFPLIAVTIQQETIEDLSFYMEKAKDPSKKMTFVIHH